MAGAGAEALLAAERGLAGIQQIAEELPARGRLETGNAQLFCHAVGRGTRGHGPGNAGNPLGIARCQRGIGREDGERVGGRHIHAPPDDEVAVTIAIGGCTEIRPALWHHQVDEFLSMDEIGVRVVAAEIGQRCSVHHRASGEAQHFFQDAMRIGAGDGTHGIELHGETGGDQRADRVEVEQRLHQRCIVVHGIDHLDARGAGHGFAGLVQINVGRVGDAVMRERLGLRKDGIGELLGRGPAIRGIELDAEIAFGSARIVACRENDAAEGAMLADHMRGGGRGEQPAPPHQNAAEPVGHRHADRRLDHLRIVEAPVAPDHERLPAETLQCIEDRLDEVLGIMPLPEHAHLFSQAGGARLLAVEGCGRHGEDHRCSQAFRRVW